MNSSECIKVRCHAADLTELIYYANKSNLTISGARTETPSVTSPRGDKHSIRVKEGDDEYMIVSLAIPIVTNTIRRSNLADYESSLKRENRMIWKIEETTHKKIIVYITAAIFSKTSDGNFHFER